MATTSQPAKDSATALRKHISYHWQLFVPLTLAMWTVVVGMGLWQRHNMEMINDARVREPLELINSRVIAAFENDVDPLPFINFIGNYYKENPLYETVCISVYKNGRLVYNIGDIIRPEVADAVGGEVVHVQADDANFFYKAQRSDDGSVEVYSMMPFDKEISVMLDEKSEDFWWIMLVIAVVLTIIGYYSTRHFGRNISMLRTFAERAATSPDFIPSADYPHDELGEISRQIVHIYQERLQAMKRLKQEHNVAMHAMEEKDRVKRQLTNNINHELKTPVASMLVCLELLRDHPELPAHERERFMQRAVDAARRLNALLKDVAAITRMDEGAHMIEKEPLDLAAIIREVAADTRLRTTMEVRVDIPDALPVAGNRRLLESVFRNLADNSIAYSGGSMLSISADAEGNICVRDDGAGVPAEHLPHIFERFYRVDKGRSREAGGTGLGLSIVRNAVALHGGSITASNDGGLRFDFHIPPSGNSGGQSRGTAS